MFRIKVVYSACSRPVLRLAVLFRDEVWAEVQEQDHTSITPLPVKCLYKSHCLSCTYPLFLLVCNHLLLHHSYILPTSLYCAHISLFNSHLYLIDGVVLAHKIKVMKAEWGWGSMLFYLRAIRGVMFCGHAICTSHIYEIYKHPAVSNCLLTETRCKTTENICKLRRQREVWEVFTSQAGMK